MNTASIQFEHGDFSRIAAIYNERHRDDKQTVTPSYVRLIVLGKLDRITSAKSQEIISVSEQFVQSKIAATQHLVNV